MPSARRRRFNVQHEIANRQKPKTQNETQISHLDSDLQINFSQNLLGIKKTKSKNKMYPNTSKRSSMLEIVSECKSTTSTGTVLEVNVIRTDKEVTASSSNIDLFTMMNNTDSIIISNSKVDIGNDNQINKKPKENKDTGHNNVKAERTSRRDKRTHRVQVRSPKRKGPVVEKNTCKKKTVGIDAVDWGDDLLIEEKNEIEVQVLKQVTEVAENAEEEERVSSHSMEDMCRICHSGEALSTESGQLISACSCRGTVGRVHVKCLERWLTESGKSRCELCGTKYVTKRVHKFGVLKALALWILSNNSKHMIVDFFGIMIVTPIAVVAAGLTGRTFAGLMTQDQMTPWPLASTFVLAFVKIGTFSPALPYAVFTLERIMIVDFFGIMIMTPIAVVAAGLTGRTFAGLMAQDQMTPWPLASTFVLACMTLVCYYCWIVSALTRHALGWWIWYRSHYEVRLQLQEEGGHSQESIANHMY